MRSLEGGVLIMGNEDYWGRLSPGEQIERYRRVALGVLRANEARFRKLAHAAQMYEEYTGATDIGENPLQDALEMAGLGRREVRDPRYLEVVLEVHRAEGLDRDESEGELESGVEEKQDVEVHEQFDFGDDFGLNPREIYH